MRLDIGVAQEQVQLSLRTLTLFVGSEVTRSMSFSLSRKNGHHKFRRTPSNAKNH